MRVRNFFLMALAASMALVSCDKSENDLAPADTSTKSVTVKLANVKAPVKVRSTQPAVQDGTTAKLSKFVIFFVDANGNMDYEGYEASDTKKENDPVTREFEVGADGTIPTIPTYHYISAAVTKVIVVGNPTWETAPTTEEALKEITVEIEDQQDVDDLVLIGEDDLTARIPENENVDGHTNAYLANVDLLPLVARLEIAAFHYAKVDEATERDYASMALNHLAINNYNGTCTYGKTASDLQTATINDETVWPFLENLTAAWHNDNNMNITLDATTTPEYINDVDVDGEGVNVYAYNVFAGTAPQLVLGMVGTKADNTTAPLYLATRSLSINNFVAGHVYRMDIATGHDNPFRFNDGHLNSPDKCVDVDVEVIPWTVEWVIPEF